MSAAQQPEQASDSDGEQFDQSLPAYEQLVARLESSSKRRKISHGTETPVTGPTEPEQPSAQQAAPAAGHELPANAPGELSNRHLSRSRLEAAAAGLAIRL